MKTKYIQCSLKNGNTYTTTWLPVRFAVEGKYVKLKQKDGSWWDGWLVTSASGEPKEFEELNRRTKFASLQN